MHKVERMVETPTQCLVCMRGNTPDDPDTMDEFWALDLERDVNWGDPTYLCKYCCEKIAMLSGFASMTELTEAMQRNEDQKVKIHDLKAKLERRETRLKKILAGEVELRKERKRTGKKAAA